MFLRNWDMQRVYETILTAPYRRRNDDATIRMYNYCEDMVTPRNASNSYPYLTINWVTTGYEGSPGSGSDSFMIWPGGKVGDVYPRIQRGIENKVARYEDYNLYSPFYGGTGVASNYHIYGQQHLGSGYKYNEEEDSWEYTVTREFKNISGKEITVEEVGVYGWQSSLMAKEVLEEPIVVQNDSYFKLSFTYKLENPHENRKIKRVQSIYNGGWNQGNHTTVLNRTDAIKNGKIIAFFYDEDYVPSISFSGWESTDKNNDGTFKSIFSRTSKPYYYFYELKSLDDVPDNNLQMSTRNNSYKKISFYYLNNVKKLNFKKVFYFQPNQTSNQFLIPNGGESIEKEDGTTEYIKYIDKNYIYIIFPHYYYTAYCSVHQLDEDFCTTSSENSNPVTFFLDKNGVSEDSEGHRFGFSNHTDYTWSCVILEAEMEDPSKPIYYDEIMP
jgi:hypothetical protein